MKINFFKSIVVFAFITLFAGTVFLTQTYTAYGANIIEFTPQIPIPGMGNSSAVGKEVDGTIQSDLLARYIKAIYDYGLAVAGVLAAIILMGAGLLWLTSGGSEAKITQAKDLIAGSIAGMVILFGSWMLLNTVNPELLKMRPISLRMVTAISKGCCASGQQAAMVTEKECKQFNGIFYPSSSELTYIVVSGRCQEFKVYCNVRRTCEGQIDFCFDSDTGNPEVLKENCGSFFNFQIKNLYEMVQGSCSKIAGCTNKRISCKGVENGELCPKLSVPGMLNDIQLDGYCYNNFCYRDRGQEGSVCGTKPGAYCSSITCSQLGNGGYYRDNSGGRQCFGTELFCCYKG